MDFPARYSRNQCGARLCEPQQFPKSMTHLDRLPKVISEMVGQTCRFAAAPGRTPPTISEMTFGNHSKRMSAARRLDMLRLTEPRSGIFAADEDSDGLQCTERSALADGAG